MSINEFHHNVLCHKHTLGFYLFVCELYDAYKLFLSEEDKNQIAVYISQFDLIAKEYGIEFISNGEDISFSTPITENWIVLKNCKQFVKNIKLGSYKDYQEFIDINWDQSPNEWEEILKGEYLEDMRSLGL